MKVLASSLASLMVGTVLAVAAAGPADAATGPLVLPDVDFGAVQVNSTTTRIVELRNDSGVAIRMTSISVNAPEFSLDWSPSGVPSTSQCYRFWNVALEAGARCSIGISVTPPLTNARTATMSMRARQASNSAAITDSTTTLTATGINGSLVVPSTDFGSVTVGSRVSRIIEIENTGPARIWPGSPTSTSTELRFDGYPSSVPHASQCGRVGNGAGLAPGGKCALEVIFTPSARGERVAQMTVPTEAGSFTATVRAVGVRSGYWMLSTDGRVYPFGGVTNLGNAVLTSGTIALKLEPTPFGSGYWVLRSDGQVQAFGDARAFGNGAARPGERFASMSSTPSGQGYWLFTDRGRVLALGDAQFFGDMSAVPLNGPVLGSVATPTGRGYYMVASDGGIFAFGDASFYGSMGGKTLNAPVMAVVPRADNRGYWLVASDGGVFAFEAPFLGSMGGTRLNRPVVGMIRFGDGYMMVGSDGGIFNFSTQPFAGSLGSNPPATPVISVGAVS
jgi:hypothetical protein